MNHPAPPDSDREAALFEAAAQRSGQDRAKFLNGACQGEPELRARLEALLAAHEDSKGLLPDTAAAARVTMKLGAAELEDQTVGQKIGRYKILEKVGEGGCGVVYVAEQTEPVRRRVALKVIKLGMDTRQVVARFEAERQALAMMDHPNIAKVLDAGATEDRPSQSTTSEANGVARAGAISAGRPYFVMELVRGIKITDYCDQNKLSTSQRLELFIQVCHAIQHAHQKGIIHRDIKPSNILVTLHDGVPVPKVIDFGIAKATEGRLTDATVYTQLHQFIGTPAYMSPEQAEMSGLDIDTRSDIYSLGVLLYELLAGSTPFDPNELLASGIDAMRKIIREKEPMRPSTRLATLRGAELTTTAMRRSVETSRLAKLLRGDLDWVVMKCLEKDRTRRYETANGLAVELRRYLSNEPVMARPPSQVYRARKAIGRNKLVFAAVSSVVLALGAGAVVSTWLLFRAIHAETSIRKERDATAQARQQADAINKFLTEHLLFMATPDENAREHHVTMEEVFESYARDLDKDPELARKPQVKAALRLALGKTYYKLGNPVEAERHLLDALNLRRNALGPTHVDTLIAQAALVECRVVGLRKFDQGDAMGLEAWQGLAKQLGRENPETVEAMFSYFAAVAIPANRNSEAEVLGRELLALREKVNGSDDYRTTDMLGNLAFIMAAQGKYADAEKYTREEQARFRRTGYADREGALYSVNNLALFRLFQGDNLEPEKLLLEAIPRAIRVQGAEHPVTLTLQHNLARVYADQGRLPEGEALAREVLPKRRRVTPGHENLARTLLILGRILVQKGAFDDAEALLQEALSILREKYATKGNLIAQTENELGAIRLARHQVSEASVYLTRVPEEFLKPNIDASPRETKAGLQRLVEYYQAVEKPELARKWQNNIDTLATNFPAVTK
jgi:serine/threonine protein kinase